MKKLMLCVLMCTLCLTLLSVSSAEVPLLPIPFAPETENASLLAENYTGHEENIFQPCYVMITVLQEQANGSVTESTLMVHAYTIEFQYEVFIAEGSYTGMRLALESYPKLHPVSSPTYPVQVSLSKISNPRIINGVWDDDSYSGTIAHGTYSLSYDSVFKFDKYGNQVDIDPQRVNTTRSYYFDFSGP